MTRTYTINTNGGYVSTPTSGLAFSERSPEEKAAALRRMYRLPTSEGDEPAICDSPSELAYALGLGCSCGDDEDEDAVTFNEAFGRVHACGCRLPSVPDPTSDALDRLTALTANANSGGCACDAQYRDNFAMGRPKTEREMNTAEQNWRKMGLDEDTIAELLEAMNPGGPVEQAVRAELWRAEEARRARVESESGFKPNVK